MRASSADRLGIRVTGKTHAPAIVFPVRLEGESPRLTVIVPASATLSGKVTPVGIVHHFRLQPGAEARDRCVGFVLRRPGHARPSLPFGDPGVFEFNEDGSFSIGGLPPGEWELMLQWWQPTAPNSRTQRLVQPPLATVTLRAGSVCVVDVDLATLAPAIIRGRVFHDGKVLPRARVTWVSREFSASGKMVFSQRLGGIDTDDSGRFHIGGIPAGAMRVSVRIVDPITGRARDLDSGDWLTVRPASRIERDFHVVGHGVTVRIVDSRGAPVGGRRLTLLHDDARRAWSLRTDADGQVTVRDAPSGRLRVIVHRAGFRSSERVDFGAAAHRPGTALDPVRVPGAGMQVRTLR